MARFRVLIIEDERDWQTEIRESLLAIVRDADVKVASDSESALDLLREAQELGHPFDLVTTDLSLAEDENKGRIKGQRVLDRLAQSGSRVIVISGHSSPEDVRNYFRRFHVEDFISKGSRDFYMNLQHALERVLAGSPTESSESGPPAGVGLDHVRLREALEDHFGERDLRTVCFDLEIDYDDLEGEGRADRARQLIIHLRRHNRLAELYSWIERHRPEIVL